MGALLRSYVLCPAVVNTNILQNAGELFGDPSYNLAQKGNKNAQALLGMYDKVGISIDQMADRVYEGIKRDIFYIVGYDRVMDVDSVATRMLQRTQDLLLGRAPSSAQATLTSSDKEELKAFRAQAREEMMKGKWSFAPPGSQFQNEKSKL